MAASDRWEKPVVRIALLLCLLSFLLMAYAGYEYKSNNTDDKILEGAQKDAQNEAGSALENISRELNSTRLFTKGVAIDLSSGKLNDSTLDKYLRAEMEKNPNIFSITVAYSPDVHNGNRTLIHCKRNGSDLEVKNTLPYDYANSSEETAAWYRNPMKSGRAGWNSPYFGIADGAYLIDYSAPFNLTEFKNGSERAGVVCASLSLESVRKMVGELKLGNTGYGFILSKEGVIISYPIREYLFGNIHELAKENEEKNRNEDRNNLCLISEKIGKNKTEDFIESNRTGQSSWIFYENISSENWTTNWTVGVVLPREEVLLDKEIEQNHSVIHVVLATFVFLFFLSVLFVSLYRYDDRSLWLLALIFSFLCILGMGTVWHLTLSESSLEDRNEDIVVFDMADVETVLMRDDGANPKAPRIPTGVFIQSLEFSTANDVTMTGYIWQNISGLAVDEASLSFSSQKSNELTIEKENADENLTANNTITTGNVSQNVSGLVTDKASSNISSQGSKEAIIKLVTEKTSPSFNFPESKETTIEKAYVDAGKGIIGWRFKTTLRQQFDYSRYPFDEEDVWIKFWNDASEGSVLVPDFGSYENLTPGSLPGLEKSLVLEGWEPQKTFFSYRNNSYNTNFGVKDFNHTDVSELYFNVDVKRDIKSPFVSDLLPIMVVATLLFVVLSITTREEKKNQFGFNSSGVLAYCASLFFVLIIAHSSLRAKIPTDSVIYLEYFYLIMYLAILAVSLNSIAFASRTDIPFIDARDNLYVKMLYWPFITGTLLLITLLNFY
jgi:hypothetical protein